MSLVLLLVILAVIAGIAVVAAGRGQGLAPAEPERSPRGFLPAGDVSRADVDGLRFTLALRGYRMDEVDDVIDRLLDELDRRDARIAELEPPTTAGEVLRGADARHDLPDDGEVQQGEGRRADVGQDDRRASGRDA